MYLGPLDQRDGAEHCLVEDQEILRSARQVGSGEDQEILRLARQVGSMGIRRSYGQLVRKDLVRIRRFYV